MNEMPTRTILVVDDNRDAADTLCDLLTLAGHRSISAYDGRAGVAAALRERPDMAFVDLGMPVLDGYGVARALRAEATVSDLPLVALTAWSDPATVQRVFASGFTYHVTKPASFAAILALIERLPPTPMEPSPAEQ